MAKEVGYSSYPHINTKGKNMANYIKAALISLALILAACGGGSSSSPSSSSVSQALGNALSDEKLVECIEYTGELIASLPAGENDFEGFVRDTVWAIDCSHTSSVYGFSYVDQITSIDGLDEFKNISYINLSHNLITDISPLFNMYTLDYVDLRSTLVSCEDINNLREWINNLEGDMYDSCP